MATIKSFTSLEQSRKLATILPLESADMYYREWKRMTKDIRIAHFGSAGEKDLPCWSLASLLGVIPKRIKEHNILQIGIDEKDFVIWYDGVGFGVNNGLPDITADNPVDACVETIIKLHEMNLL